MTAGATDAFTGVSGVVGVMRVVRVVGRTVASDLEVRVTDTAITAPRTKVTTSANGIRDAADESQLKLPPDLRPT
jgi:hypothetical protein